MNAQIETNVETHVDLRNASASPHQSNVITLAIADVEHGMSEECSPPGGAALFATATTSGLASGLGMEDPDLAELCEPAVRALAQRLATRNPLTVSIKVDDDGKTYTESYGNDQLSGMIIGDRLGTASTAFENMALGQMALLSTKGEPADEAKKMTEGLAFLAGIAPSNELEAALGVQMFAAHTLAMKMAGRAARSASGEASATWLGHFNKAGRTMAALADSLAKVRSGGKQSVEVKHIHVDNRGGGQTVVADTVVTGGGKHENDR